MSPMNYCPHCYSQVPAGNMFCPTCGATLSGFTQTPTGSTHGRKGGRLLLWLGVAALVAAVAVTVWLLFFNSKAPDQPSTSQPSTAQPSASQPLPGSSAAGADAALTPIPMADGQMLVVPRQTGMPEVTINAPLDCNCVAFFENTLDPSQNFAFYVSAGSSVTVNAPVGTYSFFYASGNIWYGPEHRFGQGTQYYKSDDIITFTQTSTTTETDTGTQTTTDYSTTELTLYAVQGGNMTTYPIDESQFPSFQTTQTTPTRPETGAISL